MGKSILKKSAQAKAGLKFPVARVGTSLKKALKGSKLSSSARVTNAVFLEESARVLLDACIEKMSEKERVKGVVRASHCAAALADPNTVFAGLLPVNVAGIYQKRK